MLINALANASGQEKGELCCWLSARDFQPEEKIKQVTRIYDEIGVAQMAKDCMNTHFNQAIEFLDNLSVAPERVAPLKALAQKMLNRQT